MLLGLVGWHSYVGFCKVRAREGGEVRVREGGKARAGALNDFHSCELAY